MDSAVTLASIRTSAAPSLAVEWQRLAVRTEATPFSHPGWVHAWTRARDRELTLATALRDGDLAAVLPLLVHRGHARTPADWHTPWMEAVYADPTALVALARGVAAEGLSRVTIDFVPGEGPTAAAFAAALTEADYRIVRRQRMRSPFIPLDGDWAGYLGGLPARKQSELRRRARRLADEGAVICEVRDGGDDLGHLLDEAFAVEASGWKGDAGTAIAADPAQMRFYRELAEWAHGHSWLRLAFLRLDGRAIAFDLSIETGGCHYLLKTGFDPAYRRLSPGMLLRRNMIERAFEGGLTSYEFCGHADPWKLEWTGHTRDVDVIDAFSPDLSGRVRRLAARAGRYLRQRRRRD